MNASQTCRRLSRMARILSVLVAVLAGCLFASARLDAGEDGGGPARVPTSGLGRSHVLVGKLDRPLGAVVRVQGVVLPGWRKGRGGPRILVQKIDGRATQEIIVLPLEPYFHRFGSSSPPTTHADGRGGETPPAVGLQLPELHTGETFEFEGYETGGYTGIPRAAYQRVGIALQTASLYFRHAFVAYLGKQTKAVRFFPADFLGREALVEGRAGSQKKKAYIIGEGWRLLVDDSASWPAHCEGKHAEALGVIRKGGAPTDYRLEDGWKRLSRLEDQVGRDVLLRGTVDCLNNECWLIYRGTNVHVENLGKLAGFSATACFGMPVAVRGRLEQAMLPNPERAGRSDAGDKELRFIVRDAAIKPLDALLSPEDLQGRTALGRR